MAALVQCTKCCTSVRFISETHKFKNGSYSEEVTALGWTVLHSLNFVDAQY